MDGLQESREVRFTPAWLTSLLQPVSSSVTWDLKGTSHRDTGGGSKLAQATGPSVLQVWTKPRIPVSLLGHGGQGLSWKLAWCSWPAVGWQHLPVILLASLSLKAGEVALAQETRPSYPSCVIFAGLDPPPGGSTRP